MTCLLACILPGKEEHGAAASMPQERSSATKQVSHTYHGHLEKGAAGPAAIRGVWSHAEHLSSPGLSNTWVLV